MEIKVNKLKVHEILSDIKKSNIFLPKFQRDLAWSQNQIDKLEESIESYSPIGTIILYKKIDNKKLLLDGQQRCTSLKKILRNKNESKKELINNYEIPIVEYQKQENKDDDIVQWFVNMNEKGTTLDKEDIHLAILSDRKIVKPKWLDGNHTDTINEMYKNKNKELEIDFSIQNIEDHQKFTITEALYLIAENLEGFSKNKDYFIMSKYINEKKSTQKIKRKLVWVKRLLICLFAKRKEEAMIEHRKNHFDIQIEKWLKAIYRSKDEFDMFCKKLSFILQEFHKKFWFWNISVSSSSAHREEYFTTIGMHSYMTIYLFNFLKENKNLIKTSKENEENKQELENVFKNYEINFLDLTSFITRESIAAGGIEGWFRNLLFSNHQNLLFFNIDEEKEEVVKNLEVLVSKIFDKARSTNKTPKEISKLCLFWFFKDKINEEYNDYRLGNNKKKETGQDKYFNFDHTIPYSEIKDLNNCTSLENISILTNKENTKKSSSLEEIYIKKDWINCVIKKSNQLGREHYKKIIKLTKKWNKRKKVNEDEFRNYLWLRKKILEQLMLNKLKEEFIK